MLVANGPSLNRMDLSRLAGLNPSGVICEIMREDGTMARLDDLMDFARAHGLKIGTIRDLIAYRLRRDHLVERVAASPFTSPSSWPRRFVSELLSPRTRPAALRTNELRRGSTARMRASRTANLNGFAT